MKLFSSFASSIAPARYADWIKAALAEASTLPQPARFRWYASALLLAFALRLKAWRIPLQALGLALMMVILDWTWGALIPALIAAALSAALLVRELEYGRIAAMIVSAGTLPIAHAVANLVPPLWPHYQYAPLGGRDWMALALFAVAAFCAVRIVEITGQILPKNDWA